MLSLVYLLTGQRTTMRRLMAAQQERRGGFTMSQSFRPVKEIWNAHSSCFVEPEELIMLLHDIAARVGTAIAHRVRRKRQRLPPSLLS